MACHQLISVAAKDVEADKTTAAAANEIFLNMKNLSTIVGVRTQ
jgi:hypothetical protein